jgi:hypothetical protein
MVLISGGPYRGEQGFVCLLRTTAAEGQLFAQASFQNFDSHIIWKQEIQGATAPGLDQTTTDLSGDLRLVSDPFDVTLTSCISM